MKQYPYFFTDRAERARTSPEQIFFDYHLRLLKYHQDSKQNLINYLIEQIYSKLDFYGGTFTFQEYVDYYATDPNIRVYGQAPERIGHITYQGFQFKIEEANTFAYLGLPQWVNRWLDLGNETIWVQPLTYYNFDDPYFYLRRGLPRVIGVLFLIDAMRRWASQSTDFHAIGLQKMLVEGFLNKMQQYNATYGSHMPYFYVFDSLTISWKDTDQFDIIIIHTPPFGKRQTKSFNVSDYQHMVDNITVWYLRVMLNKTAKILSDTKKLMSDVAKQSAKVPGIYSSRYFHKLLVKAEFSLLLENYHLEIPNRITDKTDASTRAKRMIAFAKCILLLMKALKNKAKKLQMDLDLILQLQK